MLTNREAASLILLGLVVVSILIVPKWRRHMAPSTRGVVKAMFVPRLVVVYMAIITASASMTVVAALIGLWDWGLLKDALIITATVVFPMTFRSLSSKSGGELAHRLIRDTLGLAALLTIYLDTAPLPLVGELFFQAAATLLAMLQAMAKTKAEWTPARKVFDFLLMCLGIFLLLWTTASFIESPPDWSDFFQSLFFGFWLPMSLLPFFYVFGFYGVTDKTMARFRAIKRPPTAKVVLAFMVGTRLRLSLLARFSGRYNGVAEATGFRDGLKRMRAFRDDLTRRDREESERKAGLVRHAGDAGTDENGAHLDRREFDITKKRLDWIWTCQNGQWDKQGGRYWDHLTDWIVDAERHGLPAAHGFIVETRNNGQGWRAWRRTPGGAVLGVGGAALRSQFYYQGDEPPVGWPGASSEWTDAIREEWPPDWNQDDSTRL